MEKSYRTAACQAAARLRDARLVEIITGAEERPFTEKAMHRRTRFALLALVLGQSACVRWTQVPVPTPPAPPNVISNISRVHLNTGGSVEFLTLVIATDSLFGVRNNDSRLRMTVSLDQVKRIEVRQKDAVRTLGVLGLILGGVYYSGAAGLGPNR
jgi:hypothetical protein